MLSAKSINLIAIFSGMSIAVLMGLLFSIPGFLLGAIIGVFASLSIKGWLVSMQPENRRRHRRMMRHEGMS